MVIAVRRLSALPGLGISVDPENVTLALDKDCQLKCQQRVLNILVKAAVEYRKIVSPNSVKYVISI